MKVVVDKKPRCCYECQFCKPTGVDYKCNLTGSIFLFAFEKIDCDELISFSEMINKYHNEQGGELNDPRT